MLCNRQKLAPPLPRRVPWPGWMGIPILLGCLCALAAADEITLKNGMVLRGTAVKTAGLTAALAKQNNGGPVPNISFWMVDDGVRRYFVYRRHVAQQEAVADLGAPVAFQLKQERSARTAGFPVVGNFLSMEPFDEFGRRTVKLSTQKGTVDVIQAITEIRPDHARIESLKQVWDYEIDTRTIPAAVIRSLIEKSSNRDNPSERKAAVLFYVQAQMFAEAKEELRLMKERFPEMSDWCEESDRRVGEYIGRRAINEIQRRREAGQHRLAYQFAQQFPAEHVSADVLRSAQDVVHEYELALTGRDHVLMLLDMLQAEIPLQNAQRLAALRAIVQEELHFETLERLEPFLRAESDPTLPADQKLALAYSGWLLGSANAILDLEEAIRLWDARFLVLQYLRTRQDPLAEQDILKSLEATEGISIERLALMLGNLPLPFEPPPAAPGTVSTIDVATDATQTPVRYSLLLPPEYSPAHRYPLLVVLRGEGSTFEKAVSWWGGDAAQPGWAQRRGYIVIAPHYCEENAAVYEAGSAEHEIVLRAIDHVRKRFRVDSDRIFITGHGMGGDACFDMAMSHPGVFAGAIPITGICDRFCRAYWSNAPHLPWYIVSGERDRNTLEKNSSVLNEMMKHGQEVIFCEYKERGFESYYEEQERIFEWMHSCRRVPLSETAKWQAGSLRKSDNRFYWLEARGLPDRSFPPIVWSGPGARMPHAKSYEGNMTSTGTIYVTHPGEATTIWLSPAMFDFNNRCHVRVNLKYVFNDYVKPSIEALLSDVRERGDREQLYWARLDL